MATKQTNITPRTIKVFMWNVSEPIADLLFNISSATLIVGGLLVFVGTIGSITMSAAKEYFTNERIAANEAATERAKADAEIAREGAIAAHAKALEAELALEKYKAPRTLSPSQIENLISKMKEFQGQTFQITTFWEMREPLDLSNNLYRILLASGWEYVKPETGSFLLGGMEGIQVWSHPDANENVGKAAGALAKELSSLGLDAAIKLQNPQNPKADMINVNVGTKSQ
jgi:hypothetical protein